jgi:1-aminocyclopropane-1-carboxylate deaminase/D-cysteine desulfhydrase-like pyridoxal-dependent ACC family enzyme
MEFLLAAALKHGVVRVMTSGGVGSNHALATALYARQVGLKAVQPLDHESFNILIRGMQK